MRLVQINNLCGRGSTGKIVAGISQMATQEGIDSIVFYYSQKSSLSNSVKLTTKLYIKFQVLLSRIFGNYGFNSFFVTKKLIKRIEAFKPDIVQIHNIHAHNVNLELLFDFLREKKIKVIYTFHDCWAFTGYCPHFTAAKCDHWKIGCNKCPLRKKYSWFFDKSSNNYKRKMKSFSGLDLTIVTPSAWLASLVKQSFLKNYPIHVINNGIDLDVFRPTRSLLKQHLFSDNKYIVLGVADAWSNNKGLDVFIKLSKKLPDSYQIVLVGIDKKTKKNLPTNIFCVERTHNQRELAEIYSIADVFVNPTREEVLGLTNIEALACGTPVVMFNTGGAPECIDRSCGVVVGDNDIEHLHSEIIRICTAKPYSTDVCTKRAQLFDAKDRFQDYIKLYKSLCLKNDSRPS